MLVEPSKTLAISGKFWEISRSGVHCPAAAWVARVWYHVRPSRTPCARSARARVVSALQPHPRPPALAPHYPRSHRTYLAIPGHPSAYTAEYPSHLCLHQPHPRTLGYTLPCWAIPGQHMPHQPTPSPAPV